MGISRDEEPRTTHPEAILSPLLFELSGEHPELPFAEVSATAEAEELPFREIERSDSILIAETGPAEKFARLGMTHRVLRYLGRFDEPKEFSPDLSLESSFRVRATRVREHRRDLKLKDVERVMGRTLVEAGGTVDLENPEREFRAILSGGGIYVGETLLRVDRSFTRKRPHDRPYFHPGVVNPETARVMVNLARARGTLLNPMCGNGSLMIQAGKVGARPVGLDADPDMARGSLVNTAEESVEADTVIGDARNLPFRDASFDAAVTDLPYGRSVRVMGTDLVNRSMREMERVLKTGSHMVVTAPEPLDGAEKRFEQRVHRSLTRYINVFQVQS